VALDLWFREDVAQHIAAAAIAGLAISRAHGGTNLEYTRGWLESQMSVAASFGIPWAQIKSAAMQGLVEAGQDDLLQLVERIM